MTLLVAGIFIFTIFDFNNYFVCRFWGFIFFKTPATVKEHNA
ncbi:hypothetical protein MNBD_ALPHA11-1244 [hydrothermal vent metagenome]|uniref:Uncharacterized protein n=1 Tax=hydrothermal vent metagenome TaxID=652676 RepID=A0A3B0U0L8_9ZZZZ